MGSLLGPALAATPPLACELMPPTAGMEAARPLAPAALAAEAALAPALMCDALTRLWLAPTVAAAAPGWPAACVVRLWLPWACEGWGCWWCCCLPLMLGRKLSSPATLTWLAAG